MRPHYFSVPQPDGMIWAAVRTSSREDAQSRVEADDPIRRQMLVAYHGRSVRREVSKHLRPAEDGAAFSFQPAVEGYSESFQASLRGPRELLRFATPVLFLIPTRTKCLEDLLPSCRWWRSEISG
jgi:hypothetical protein